MFLYAKVFYYPSQNGNFRNNEVAYIKFKKPFRGGSIKGIAKKG